MKEYLVDLDGEQYLESAEDESEAIRLARTRHKAEHVRHQTCTLCGEVPSVPIAVDASVIEQASDPSVDTVVLEDPPTE